MWVARDDGKNAAWDSGCSGKCGSASVQKGAMPTAHVTLTVIRLNRVGAACKFQFRN